MSEAICTCHCGGAMFYRHLHAESCVLSREGEEAPKSELQTLRDERDRLITEYVRVFRLGEPIAKMLSELSILPIGCSREQELAWKMAVKNFRHYQRDYAADVLLQAALTPAGQRWTRTKPTEPGWYWFRFGDGWSHYVFCVYQMRGQLMVDLPGGVEKSLFLMEDGEWQGPLTPNEATA